MRCRYFWEKNNSSLCVSEANLNYNCIAAQSRDSNQAEAKPCWTRLNQAWTSSTQHALRFKPWLIGLKASKSPFPAVTGIGLGKESDGEKEEENKAETGKLVFPCINLHMPHWINTIFLPFLDILSILCAQLFLLAQLIGNPRCCICPVAQWCRETINVQAIWPTK